MPPTSPRIHVSFPERTYNAIDRVALLSHQTKSSIIRQIIEQQTEVLEQLAAALEHVNKIKDRLTEKEMLNLAWSLAERQHYTGYQEQKARLEMDDMLADLQRLQDEKDLAEHNEGAG